MNTTRRTSYSPIRPMSSSNHQQDYHISRSNSRHHHRRDEQHVHQPSVHTNAETNQHHQLSAHNHNNLEEVYLTSCCGTIKELHPAIKYMPLFRSLFFPFNFLVFAFGLANLGMGLWFRIDPKVYEIHKYIETQNFTIAGWILLFGGFFACLIALVGFAATAARQSVGLLSFYLIVIVALTISFIGTIALLTVFGLGRHLERFLTKEIYEQIRRRSMNADVDLFVSTDATHFMDFLQVKMRCCGATDFRDYQKLGMIIPTTCYTIQGNYINAPGCGRAIRELLDIRAGLAAGFSTGSVVTQIVAIILASMMICSIYNQRAEPRPIESAGRELRPSDELYLPSQDISSHSRQLQPESGISSVIV